MAAGKGRRDIPSRVAFRVDRERKQRENRVKLGSDEDDYRKEEEAIFSLRRPVSEDTRGLPGVSGKILYD